MSESIGFLLQSVAKVIEDEILPSLEAARWPASRLRSAVMILRYAEERVAREQAVLENGIAMIRAFFAELEARRIARPAGWPRPDAMPPLPAPDPALAAAADGSDLARTYEDCRARLGWLVRAAGRARIETGRDDTAFRAALHALLAKLHADEQSLTQPAMGYQVI